MAWYGRRRSTWFEAIAATLAVCALLVCCGGAVTFVWQQYEGAPLPKERIAILRQTGSSSTVLVAVDGKSVLAPLESQNRLHVEVLPGLHEVDVAAPSLGLRRALAVRLLAEAGKVYRVEVTGGPVAQTAPDDGEPRFEGGDWTAHAYEVDRETDATRGIADAPSAPAATVPAARPAPEAGPLSPPAGRPAPAAQDAQTEQQADASVQP
jgi:hypothetical protein